ncbi:MAG: hypothetical protein IJ228_11150 [Succinivibrio sp.]|nr:hypothetical protein [Succinivibrio sp.]
MNLSFIPESINAIRELHKESPFAALTLVTILFLVVLLCFYAVHLFFKVQMKRKGTASNITTIYSININSGKSDKDVKEAEQK